MSEVVLPPGALAFLAERHLASCTTLRPDGSPHVTAVGVTYEDDRGLARVITGAGSRKVAHLRAASGRGRVALCQVDGRRWLTLEGWGRVSDDPAGETYWKVANGIRLSGMPAFSHVLNQTEMWQVSQLLANADKPQPPGVLTLLKQPLDLDPVAPQ